MTGADRLRIAFLGCGSIAEAHWDGIRGGDVPIDVVALIDTDSSRAARLAALTGGRPYGTLADALGGQRLDAADIMLPHHLHEDAAVAALEAGLHVLVEKPMAPTIEACARMIDVAARAGRILMVSEQSQFWPEVELIGKLVAEGAIGDVVGVEAFYRTAEATGFARGSWRYSLKATGGGICIDGLSHWVRPLRIWFGEIADVSAVTARPLAEMEGESLAFMLVRFSSGLVGTIGALKAGTVVAPRAEFRITGTRGEIVAEAAREGRILLYSETYPNGHIVLGNKSAGRAQSFASQLKAFADDVRSGGPRRGDPFRSSLGELELALAAYASEVTGSRQPLRHL